MSHQFNIATVFSAVNNLTAPIRVMTQQINQFAHAAGAASVSTAASLNTAGAAANTLHRNLNSFNYLNFNVLTSRLRGVTEQINNLSRGFSRAGNAALGVGLAGVAAGFGLNQTLEPERVAQRATGALGVIYAPGMSIDEQERIGKKQFAISEALALKLPGGPADIADFRALTKSYGIEGNYELIRGFTDSLMRMKKSYLDSEVISSLQSMLIGNESDIFKKAGLQAFTKSGRTGIKETSTGEEHSFKTMAEKIQWISDYLHKNNAGGTEALQKMLESREGTAKEAVGKLSKDAWEQSGGLKLYMEKLTEFTKLVGELAPKVANFIKPIVELATQFKSFTNGVLIGIPALVGIGLALKAVGFALSGFAGVLGAVTWTIGTLPTVFGAVTAPAGFMATAVTTAGGTAVLALGSVLAPIAALVGALVALRNHFGEISAGFIQMKQRITADWAAWKFPALNFSGVWDDLMAGFTRALSAIRSLWANWKLPSISAPDMAMPKAKVIKFPDMATAVPKSIYPKSDSSGNNNQGIYAKQGFESLPSSPYSKPTYLQDKQNIIINQSFLHNVDKSGNVQSTSKISSPKLNVRLNAGVNQRGAR